MVEWKGDHILSSKGNDKTREYYQMQAFRALEIDHGLKQTVKPLISEKLPIFR